MNYGARRGHAIGKISEEIAEAALERAVESGKITGFMKVNGQGVDFAIGLPGQIVNMLLEIKSSNAGRRAHQLKYGADTPVIIVRHGEKTMSQQDREALIFVTYLRLLSMIDKEMRNRRSMQNIPAATAA